MKIEKLTSNNVEIAHVTAEGVIIEDVQSAVDLMMTVKYETGVKNIAVSKDLFTDRFFVLSSGLAGEILQKLVNYQFRIAIYGDYSKYTSKPLKDFMYESNNGKDVFFTNDIKSAVDKLSTAK